MRASGSRLKRPPFVTSQSAWTTTGSNWVPAQRRSSARASNGVSRDP